MRGAAREGTRPGRGDAPRGKGGAAPRGAAGPAPQRRHGAEDAPSPRPIPARAQGGPPPGLADRAEPGTHWLYGLHAVAAALANPRRGVKRLLLTAEAEAALVERLPKPWRVQAERVEDRTRFHSFLPEDSVHQGAALLVHPLPNARLEEALAASPGPVLLLDQVTDPRNVGAILRSAAAFGAAAVVMQDRHAPPETGALARAASGALEVVPVVREVNLSRVIQLLQGKGAWVLGLVGEATRTLAEAAPRDRRAVLVLGAEDSGLRRLQRETCDELVRLPIAPAMESLNVAAAAAVALYELARGD
ncbi:23S rRNA (guanosine(2251)-2'-O)-methyltransferase RlmB [Roseomonas sp. OT10]|uniref:23S rRNA (guanosine(2251)-2'-O)-methyltransferase RlmB n=1 Tax=Roseomonas cutis TaxID=2897332 RepID=UPI001E570313|nr:23S rRNA (guanosine(2251)-2'-O)-methyltransferase RlmB [Roseomonas sp. OT10]UFN47296.1 23S rRNA (guanosine(2251)-2'-O)-methyltransferase RlmB [Roseomonas sp. OT10]